MLDQKVVEYPATPFEKHEASWYALTDDSPLERMAHEGKGEEAVPLGEFVDMKSRHLWHLWLLKPQERSHPQPIVSRTQVFQAPVIQAR